MGVTEILQRKTYDLDDFFSRQLSLTSDFAKNLGEFRTIVCQLVLDTCKVCNIFDRELVSRGIYKRVFYYSTISYNYRIAFASTIFR